MSSVDSGVGEASLAFRNGMRFLGGGVCAITVGRPGDRTGMAATSVVSLSVDPPALIVCVNQDSSSWRSLQRYNDFGVNVLGLQHVAVADRFAGRGGCAGEERFEGADWVKLETGAPILADALVAFDCEVEDRIDRHTHTLFIGRVKAVSTRPGTGPLLYWHGSYGELRTSQSSH